MLLKRIDVGTELVSRVFESDSYSTEVFVYRVPVNRSLNALVTCNGIRVRSRGVWHRLSELSPNVT